MSQQATPPAASVSALTLLHANITGTSLRLREDCFGSWGVAGEEGERVGSMNPEVAPKPKQGIFKKLVTKLTHGGSSGDAGAKGFVPGRVSEDTQSSSAASNLSCPSLGPTKQLRCSEDGTPVDWDGSGCSPVKSSNLSKLPDILGTALQRSSTQQPCTNPLQPGTAFAPCTSSCAEGQTNETSLLCNTDNNSDWDILGAGASTSQVGQLTLAHTFTSEGARHMLVAASSLYDDAQAVSDRMERLARHAAGAMPQSWSMEEQQGPLIEPCYTTVATSCGTCAGQPIRHEAASPPKLPSHKPCTADAPGTMQPSVSTAAAGHACTLQPSGNGGHNRADACQDMKAPARPSRAAALRASEELTRKFMLIHEEVAKLTDEELSDPRSTSRMQLISSTAMPTPRESSDGTESPANGHHVQQGTSIGPHLAAPQQKCDLMQTAAALDRAPAGPEGASQTSAPCRGAALTGLQGAMRPISEHGQGLQQQRAEGHSVQHTPATNMHEVPTSGNMGEEVLCLTLAKPASGHGQDGMQLLPSADMPVPACMFHQELSPAGAVSPVPAFEFLLGTNSKGMFDSSNAHAAQVFPGSAGAAAGQKASPAGLHNIDGDGLRPQLAAAAAAAVIAPNACVVKAAPRPAPGAVDRPSTSLGWVSKDTIAPHTNAAPGAQWHGLSSSKATSLQQPSPTSMPKVTFSTQGAAPKFSVAAALGKFTGTRLSNTAAARRFFDAAPRASPLSIVKPQAPACPAQKGDNGHFAAPSSNFLQQSIPSPRPSTDGTPGGALASPAAAAWPAPSITMSPTSSVTCLSPVGLLSTTSASAPVACRPLPVSHKFDLPALGSGVLLMQSIESVASAAAARARQAAPGRSSSAGSDPSGSADAAHISPASSMFGTDSSPPARSQPIMEEADMRHAAREVVADHLASALAGTGKVPRSQSVPCLHEQGLVNTAPQPSEEQAHYMTAGQLHVFQGPATGHGTTDRSVHDSAGAKHIQSGISHSETATRGHTTQLPAATAAAKKAGSQEGVAVRNADKDAQQHVLDQHQQHGTAQVHTFANTFPNSVAARGSAGLLCDTQHSGNGTMAYGSFSASRTFGSLLGTSPLSAMTSSGGPMPRCSGIPELSDHSRDGSANRTEEATTGLVHGLRAVLHALAAMGYDARDTAAISRVRAALSDMPQLSPDPRACSLQQDQDQQLRSVSRALTSGAAPPSCRSSNLEDLLPWLQMSSQVDMPLGSNSASHRTDYDQSDDDDIPAMVPDETGMMVAVPRRDSMRPRPASHDLQKRSHHSFLSSVTHRSTGRSLPGGGDSTSASPELQLVNTPYETWQGMGRSMTQQGQLAAEGLQLSSAAKSDVWPLQESRRWMYVVVIGGTCLVVMNLVCMAVALYTMREMSRH